MRLTGGLSTAGLRRVAPSLPRSRLLLASGLLAMITGAGFAVAFGSATPVALLWVPTPVSAAILAVMYWRTSQCAHLPEVTRRFWRHLAISGVLIGIAATVQTGDALLHPAALGPHIGPVMLAFDGVGVFIIMFALYRLPLGRRSTAERLRVALDASTVMVATAMFIWHFQTRPSLGDQDGLSLITSAFLIVLAQLTVFAVVKVVLSSHAFIDKTALRLLALGMLVGSLLAPLAAPVGRHSHLFVNQLSVPIVFFIGACAVERQRTAHPQPTTKLAERHPPRFSALPYAAVAAVDALLMSTIWSGDEDAQVVGGCAVLITAVIVLRQITAFRDNHELLDQLDHSATHDALTQLPNRELFHERLNQALIDSDGLHISVILIDLDDFKTVNDTLGHAAGDTLLIAVADRLRESVRAEDTVARLGGDEFAIVMRGGGEPAAEQLICAIVARLATAIRVEQRDLRVRASFGVVAGRPGDDAGELLRHADIAMYEAKARHDGRWQHYTPGMQARGAALEQATTDLRQALDTGQLRLYYQPVVTLEYGDVVGVEALIRRQHPDRGLLGADEIIPAAESSGLIIDIGQWVLHEACRQMTTWLTAHPETAPRTMSVNVSARQLREPAFGGQVAAALNDHGLQPGRLTIEITESTAVGGDATADTLAELRALGVRIALDDFGTGQSTLTLLATCPVDQIKLDRSFVPDATNAVIASAVLQLARGFGVETVAEGVETATQAELLRALGYDRAQGYHFARPMPADALEAMLVRGARVVHPA